MPKKNTKKSQPAWMKRVYNDNDLLVRHAAKWWTLGNLACPGGHKDPATTSMQEVPLEIDQRSLDGEHAAWQRVARKSLEIVLKKHLPLNLASMAIASSEKPARDAYLPRR